MIPCEDVFIKGDGETSYDFYFVEENTVQANILTAASKNDEVKNYIYTVTVMERTTLNDLFNAIKVALNQNGANNDKTPIYPDFRIEDVWHSQVNESKISYLLGYVSQFPIDQNMVSSFFKIKDKIV